MVAFYRTVGNNRVTTMLTAKGVKRMKKVIRLAVVAVAVLALTAVSAIPVVANGTLPRVTWLPPLTNQDMFQLKDGSTLPIKFTLTDPVTGAFVEDTSLRVDVNKVLFKDDFNDGNADGWAPVAGDGSWSVEDGLLRCVPDITYPRILATNTLSYENYVFEADARVVNGRGYALIFRAADYQSLYSFQYQAGTGQLSLRLYQFTNFPIGADVAPIVLYTTDNNWHHLKVKVVGNNIKCYVDGIKVFDVTDEVDPAPLQGGIGFRTWANSTVEFDNVLVLGVLGEPANAQFVYGEGADNVRISYDTVFSDDFEDGDADGWLTVGTGGIWTVEDDESFGSKVYSQSDTSWTTTTTYDTYWRSYGGSGWENYSVEAKVKIVSGGFAPIVGIFFRVQGSDLNSGYYTFRIDARSDTGPALIKSPNTILAGGHPGYPQFVNEPAVIGQIYTLKVVVNGSSIKCYVDGVKKIEWTDSTYATGGIGVGTFNAHAHFDDVKVQVPHYIANLHTKESGMATGEYLITIWSGDGDQLGTYLFDLTDAIQGKGRGKGKA